MLIVVTLKLGRVPFGRGRRRVIVRIVDRCRVVFRLVVRILVVVCMVLTRCRRLNVVRIRLCFTLLMIGR